MVSLEMVDRSDQRAAAARYNGMGDNRNDLYLEEEGAVGDGSRQSSEYFGLELEDELKRRADKKRKYTYTILAVSLLLLGAVIVQFRNKGGTTNTNNNNSNGSNNGYVGGSNNDKKPTSKSDRKPFDLWATNAPLPTFKLCPPPLIPISKQQESLDVFHMINIVIVPEAPTEDDYDDQWKYTFSDMDMNADASLLAVGLDDFSGAIKTTTTATTEDDDDEYSHLFDDDTGYGLVRAFGFDCESQQWKQVGQDLLGSNLGEQFGHKISSSTDGHVMAIAAPQNSYSDGNGYVEVYSLNGNQWELLGSRIERLDNSEGADEYYTYESSYSNIGHAIDIDDNGDTLAILALDSDDDSYTIRVFSFDVHKADWVRKGKNIAFNITFPHGYEFNPQLTLHTGGDKLSMVDPTNGIVTYTYHFTRNEWLVNENKLVQWTSGTSAWLSSADTDDAGDLILFSGWEETEISEDEDGDGIDEIDETKWSNTVKLIDFAVSTTTKTGTGSHTVINTNGTEVYATTFSDFDVKLYSALSDNGKCAAIVATKTDINDKDYWVEGAVEYVGSMTIITDKDNVGQWEILGKDTAAEGIGVPGNYLTLSGDGTVAAVGSDTVVALYGININNNKVIKNDNNNNPQANNNNNIHSNMNSNSTRNNSTSGQSSPPSSTATLKFGKKFDLCLPYSRPNNDTSSSSNNNTPSGFVGYLEDQIPTRHDLNPIPVAMNFNGSIIAIGMDSYQLRGMVRVFGWDCSSQSYIQLGQDIFGQYEFDGFGQSIDISSNGIVLAIGANQPPPGKSGYVEVYKLENIVTEDGSDGVHWSIVGSRMTDENDLVEDLGREVKLSYDGKIVMFLGSVLEQVDSGWYDSASFIRVMELGINDTTGQEEWMKKGSDLIGTISYDDYGSDVHISQSGDGMTLGVTGSYSNFLAKIYTFNNTINNWTETLIPPIKYTVDYDYDFWDVSYETYFTGSGIAINRDGKSIAISGKEMVDDNYVALVRLLKWNTTTSNYTSSRDPIEYEEESWTPSAIDINELGNRIAVGISTHEDDQNNQGALFVALTTINKTSTNTNTNDNGWNLLNKIDGKHKGDMLGSRVCMTRDGSFVAASSHKGYISFYKIV